MAPFKRTMVVPIGSPLWPLRSLMFGLQRANNPG